MAVNKNPLSGKPPNSHVDGWVMIQSNQLMQSSAKNFYNRWWGFDAAGVHLKGTVYGAANMNPPVFEPFDVVAMTGKVGTSKDGSYDVWAATAIRVDNKEDAEEFKNLCIPTYPKDELTATIAKLKEYAYGISNEGLKKLSISLFDYMEPHLPFIPAGKFVHKTTAKTTQTWRRRSITWLYC